MPPNFSTTANEIWAVADLLRGDLKQSQYGRIILPFALLLQRVMISPEKKKGAHLAPSPNTEQHAAFARLDDKCSQLEALMAEAERAISLHKKTRNSHISASVIGKIGMRVEH